MSFKQALVFAELKHRGQLRKYSDTPYIIHPIRVANHARSYFGLNSTEIDACILHDVVEDCGVTLEEIEEKFGYSVRKLVDELTSFSKKDEMTAKLNRAERKKADLEYLSKVSTAAKIIKAIDRIDNLQDMAGAERGFYYKYVNESKELYEVLKDYLPLDLKQLFTLVLQECSK